MSLNDFYHTYQSIVNMYTRAPISSMYKQPPPIIVNLSQPPPQIISQPPPQICSQFPSQLLTQFPLQILSLPTPEVLLQPPPQVSSRSPAGLFQQQPKVVMKRKSRWSIISQMNEAHATPLATKSFNQSKLNNTMEIKSLRISVDRKRGYKAKRESSRSRSISRDKDNRATGRRSRSRDLRMKRCDRKLRSISPRDNRLCRYTSPFDNHPSTSVAACASSQCRGTSLFRRMGPPHYSGSSSSVEPESSNRRSNTLKHRSIAGLKASITKPTTERKEILKKWLDAYCHTGEEVHAKVMEIYKQSQLAKNGEVEGQLNLDRDNQMWTRSTPAEQYYSKKQIIEKTEGVLTAGTDLLWVLCSHFKDTLVLRAEAANASKPKYEPPPRKNRARVCKHKTEQGAGAESSSEEQLTDEEDCTMEELTRKQQHPDRLHREMWYNDPGEMNDGPLCRCSKKSRKSGIRHGIYPGEEFLQICDKNTNNADTLFHYRITISPPTNFLIKTPTIIHHDEHEFIFEGFSMFSHKALVELPTCKVIRFNIEYTILYTQETVPENFTIRELDLLHDYLFRELLELVDLDFKAFGDDTGCSQFHFMPRFVRELKPNGKEILSMNVVLEYMIKSSGPLIKNDQLEDMVAMGQHDWQVYADEIKGMVVTYPGKKPCSVRVDQLDRNIDLQHDENYIYPEIVHFGIRPPQLSYAGNPEYQKAWRDYVKFRHLLANMSKPKYDDKRKLEAKEAKLQEMRTQSKMKRDVTIAVSAEGFYRTGIMCDVIQHAMLIPVLVCHLRFHNALDVLETELQYKFRNRALLQLALTHPSYRENFGTNPDHARNSLTNCGIRQPEYGDRRIHYMNTRKRGINTLINIMSRFGSTHETESLITHNERLEFLGDAVVEFLSSVHLFHLFPDLEEGGLATYRAAIVQNQHLAVLARVLKLDRYMLYAHGSDLCHDLELRHAMANCFEALMGALFLDGGIKVVDDVFSRTLFSNRPDCYEVWVDYPPHPLQEQESKGDRHWISKFELLKKLTQFEDSIGLEFNHIRLLARAFTDRSVGYTNLTLGSNQRLEFLGDTVLQLIASEYLYKFFPEHHEGHLSLLRSSLVNNRTQAVVCDDLSMSSYAVYNNPKADLKTKDRADLLEAFIGALFVDRGLTYCQGFCEVTLFPRLQDFIMNQDWNDPKSKLQQCCLTLRTMDGGEPDIPVYKVIECKGPTNTRVYTVAVYFRGDRLASAMGHSIQQAEMNAAKEALDISHELFPQLDHQKRVIAKSMKRQQPPNRNQADCSGQQSTHTIKNNGDNETCDKSALNRSISRNRNHYQRDYSSHRGDSRHNHTTYNKEHRESTPSDNRSLLCQRESRPRQRTEYSHFHKPESRLSRERENRSESQRDSRSNRKQDSQQYIKQDIRTTQQINDVSSSNQKEPDYNSTDPLDSEQNKDFSQSRQSQNLERIISKSSQRYDRSTSNQRDSSHTSFYQRDQDCPVFDQRNRNGVSAYHQNTSISQRDKEHQSRYYRGHGNYKRPADINRKTPHPITLRSKSPNSYSRNRFKRNKKSSDSD